MTVRARRAVQAAIGALIIVALPGRLTAQSLTVRAVGDMLQVRGAGLRLIEGVVADHLKDGRSVRVDFEMTILDKTGGSTVTQNRQSFGLSFDLWEQRYAVTRMGTSPRSISHLAARDAEAWCLEGLALPLTALGRFARDQPFFVRLEYRVQDQLMPEKAESPFTLRTLIDALSRRNAGESPGRSFEAGPFRVGN